MQRKKSYSEEQKTKIIEDIQKKKASGERSIYQSCDHHGVTTSAYYEWLKTRRKKLSVVPTKPIHHVFPVEAESVTLHAGGSITIKGTPRDIGMFLRSVANGGG
jgi:transposase-like protein